MKYVDQKEFVQGLCPGINIVVGANGTGKSTLLRQITEGSEPRMVIFDGRLTVKTKAANSILELLDPTRGSMLSVPRSSGEVESSVTRVLTTSLQSDDVLVWDNPALFMDPTQYPVLAETFAILAARGVQIVIATHNPLLTRWIVTYASGGGYRDPWKQPMLLSEFDVELRKADPVKYVFHELTVANGEVTISRTLHIVGSCSAPMIHSADFLESLLALAKIR